MTARFVAWGQAQLSDRRRYISPIGQLLQVRYESPPLANIVGWPELQAADLFLTMWSLRAPLSSAQEREWIPHAAVLLRDPPRFLTDVIRICAARQIASALGLPSPEALRDLYVDKVSKQMRERFPVTDISFL